MGSLPWILLLFDCLGIASGFGAEDHSMICLGSMTFMQDPAKSDPVPQDPKKKGAPKQDPKTQKKGDPAKADPLPQDPKKQGKGDPAKADPLPQDPKKKATGDAKPGKIDPTNRAAEILQRSMPEVQRVKKPPDDPPKPVPVQPKPDLVNPGQQKPKQDPQDPRPDPQGPERAAETLRRRTQTGRAPEEGLPRTDPQGPDRVAGVLSGPEPTIIEAAQDFVRGSLSLRYRYRKDEGAGNDNDLLGMLALSLGDEEKHPLTGHFLGYADWDLDGANSNNSLNGISETYDNEVHGEVYEAYVDLHRLEPVSMTRIGRQAIFETPIVLYFDGGRLESKEWGEQKVKVGGFAGVQNHIYESSNDGDFIAGAFLSSKLWKGSRVRFDWTLAHDDLSSRPDKEKNSFYGLGLWQNFGTHTQLSSNYSFLEGESRDLQVQSSNYLEDWDLQLRVQYYQLFKTQRALATEFDPFFDSAFDYYPYYQFQTEVTKGFGDHFFLSGGTAIRRVTDSDDEGEFNRDFTRFFVSPDFEDLGVEGLSLSLPLDYWGTEEGEDVVSYGADLSMQFNERIRTSLGSDYSLYKDDLQSGRERERVRTFYVRGDYKATPFRFTFGYEYEHASDENYHEFDARVIWTF